MRGITLASSGSDDSLEAWGHEESTCHETFSCMTPLKAGFLQKLSASTRVRTIGSKSRRQRLCFFVFSNHFHHLCITTFESDFLLRFQINYWTRRWFVISEFYLVYSESAIDGRRKFYSTAELRSVRLVGDRKLEVC